jgi:hypothetical protein
MTTRPNPDKKQKTVVAVKVRKFKLPKILRKVFKIDEYGWTVHPDEQSQPNNAGGSAGVELSNKTKP